MLQIRFISFSIPSFLFFLAYIPFRITGLWNPELTLNNSGFKFGAGSVRYPYTQSGLYCDYGYKLSAETTSMVGIGVRGQVGWSAIDCIGKCSFIMTCRIHFNLT